MKKIIIVLTVAVLSAIITLIKFGVLTFRGIGYLPTGVIMMRMIAYFVILSAGFGLIIYYVKRKTEIRNNKN